MWNPWVILGLALSLAGCGGGASLTGLAPVTGKVTLDGQSLGSTQVIFVPTGTEGRACSAQTDASGNYELVTNTDKGAMPGSYKVTVSRMTLPDGNVPTGLAEGMDLGQLEASGRVKESLPPRYSILEQTELKFDVKSGGKNEYNIDLKK